MNELIGKIILDRYRIDKFLGRGGMAEVYKVWDTHRNAWLAMKVLHADLALDHAFLRRFKREAQTLERLQHPNIVRFYGLERQNRFVFMLMDYVDGESLKPKIFDAQGPLPFEQIYSITRELAWALKYAHSEGYVHSDVKPGNIMLDEKGHVMLSDFGIARMTDTATMTMIGAGTPAYMAPEQIRGESPSIQTDIYALGIVLYEMLTGERPFNGELATISGTVGEKIRWEQMNLNVPSPTRLNKKITPELEDLVLRALAKDRHDRFHDVGEFLAEFSQIFQDEMYCQPSVFSERDRKEKEGKENAHQAALRKEDQQEKTENIKKFFSKKGKRFLLIGGVVIFLVLGYVVSNIEVPAMQEPTKILTTLIPATETLVLPTSTSTSFPTPTFTSSPTTTSTPTEIPPTLTPMPTLGVGSKKFLEQDSMTMVYVPAGEFQMGFEESYYSDQTPLHTVFLDAFWIDQTEVTNAMYAECVADGVCDEPSERSSYTRDSYYGNSVFDDYPVIYVLWEDAKEYCVWAGRRLPSEAEWEKAAGWNEDTQRHMIYPWGNTFSGGEANSCDVNCPRWGHDGYYNDGYEETAPVASYERGRSFYGAYDMAGNVSEWVNDWYSRDYYASSPISNPLGTESGDRHVERGGSWAHPQLNSSLLTYLRSTYRGYGVQAGYSVGFRCAMDAD